MDINNKIPYLGQYEEQVRIYENASDVSLAIIPAFDDDRDEPHNLVQFSINFESNSELQKYFSINEITGELRVKVLDEYNQLDRDTEPSEYFISINVEDNRGIGSERF